MSRVGSVGLLLALVLAPAAAVADDVLDELVRHSEASSRANVDRALADAAPELWFCGEKPVDPRQVDRKWCALAAQAAARCPGLAAVCAKQAPPVATQPSPRRSEDGPDWLRALAEPVFWLLAAGALGFVLYHLFKALSGLRRERPEPELAPAEAAGASVEQAAAPAPTLSDAERWLELSQKAAGEGRYAFAIRASYAALVHSLRAHGLLSLEPAQTNGDLLRSLAEHPDLARELRAVVRETEVVEFGGREATRDGFERAFQRARAVVQRLAATMAALALLLSTSGCGDQSSSLPRSLDHGPDGHHLLKSVLAASGSKVRKRYLPLDRLDGEVDRVIVTGQLEEEDWSALLAWTAQGGELVVAGSQVRELAEDCGVRFVDQACGAALAPSYQPEGAAALDLVALGREHLALEPAASGEYDEEVRNVVLSCGEKPYWVTTTHGDGVINLLAESDYLRNASLASGDNALFVARTLGGSEATIELVGEWTGSAASSPLASLRRSGLMPALLHLLLLGALFAWRYGAAFGKRRDPRETRQRSFVEHVRVLGACYERAQATRLVLAHYGGWLIERLSKRALAGRRGGVVVTAGAVAARTGISEGEAAALVTEVKLAQGSPPDGSAPDDLIKVRRLEELVSRTGANP